MINFPAFITYALNASAALRYPLVFVGTVVEGPLLMIASGFLWHLGFFSFWPLFIAILAGDLAGDIAWYYVGYFFLEPALRRHGKFFGITLELFEKIKTLFHRYRDRILFISKVTIGFGFSLGTLMVAGAIKIPVRKYIWMNFLGELILVTLLLTIGYFLGQFYTYITDSFKVVTVICLAVIVLSAGYGFTRYLKNQTAAL